MSFAIPYGEGVPDNSNVFIRDMTQRLIAKGGIVPRHGHEDFDHRFLILLGSALIKAWLPSGQYIERTIFAPDHILIRAKVEHEIISLEDGTSGWCVFAHRFPNGEVSQAYTGWTRAYA